MIAHLCVIVGTVLVIAAITRLTRHYNTRCAHGRYEPVRLIVTDELVAWICLDCGKRLEPAERQ